jgi:signal transduction histidine kinase
LAIQKNHHVIAKKIRVRMSRNKTFDEDSKVLIVTVLFCLIFSVVGFQETLGTTHLIVLGLVQLFMVVAIGEIRGISLIRIPSPKLIFYFFLILFINISARYFTENAIDTSLFVLRWLRSLTTVDLDSKINGESLLMALRVVHYLIAFGIPFFVASVIDHYCKERKSILKIEAEKQDAEFQIVSHLAHNIKPKLSSAQSVLSHLQDFIHSSNLGEAPLQKQFYEGQTIETVMAALQKAKGALRQVDDEIMNIRNLITEEINDDDFQKVNIAKLFSEEIIPLFNDKSGKFHIEIEMEPKCDVVLHKHSFIESMNNLIRNALVHGFTNHSFRHTIKFVVRKKKGNLIVDYLNDGAPLPQELNQSNLLAYGVKSLGSPGMGLGMAYVGRMIKAHHGTFEILDDPDYNVHFRITLPKGGMF